MWHCVTDHLVPYISRQHGGLKMSEIKYPVMQEHIPEDLIPNIIFRSTIQHAPDNSLTSVTYFAVSNLSCMCLNLSLILVTCQYSSHFYQFYLQSLVTNTKKQKMNHVPQLDHNIKNCFHLSRTVLILKFLQCFMQHSKLLQVT